MYAAASTFSFFICVYDILRPLILGGEAHIVPDAVRKDVSALSGYYLENKITMGFISPQLLKNFRSDSPYLRRILCGVELASGIYSENYETVNVYGTSETGLVSSFTIDRPDVHMIETDNRFTANVLYRLGFSWPFIDDRYLERVMTSLDALDFFFMD